VSIYVAQDGTLGNPGVFGFIGTAIKSVAGVLTGSTTVAPKIDLSKIQLPTVPTIKTESKVDIGTVGLIAGAAAGLLLIFTMTKKRGR
jgi:hypothetical protein